MPTTKCQNIIQGVDESKIATPCNSISSLRMKLQNLVLALAAAVEAASAAQLLICSDSTTANYALDDALQGYEPLRPCLPSWEQANKSTGGATSSTTTQLWKCETWPATDDRLVPSSMKVFGRPSFRPPTKATLS